MRTAANGNNDEMGSTNDPDPKFTGSIGNKVSTIEKGQGQTYLSTKFSTCLRRANFDLLIYFTDYLFTDYILIYLVIPSRDGHF